jgi:hypothetical protein
VREEQVGAGQAQDPRVDELARAVESLRAETERVSARPAVDPGLNQMLAGAVSRLESVEAHLGADAEARRFFEHALEDLRAQVAALTAMPAGADTSATDAAIARLAERLDGLEALEERIERLADTVAELPARAATNGESADEIDADLFQNEMERTRMSIERLTLHIAEHDRALSEMMRGRGVAQRLDELEARLVELATSRPAQAPSSPNTAGIVQRRELGEAAHDMNRLVRRIEAAEEASHADREKLLTRLERMATSIDWRLQRLESAGETAA